MFYILTKKTSKDRLLEIQIVEMWNDGCGSKKMSRKGIPAGGGPK
jgi:hypothetical protein